MFNTKKSYNDTYYKTVGVLKKKILIYFTNSKVNITILKKLNKCLLFAILKIKPQILKS